MGWNLKRQASMAALAFGTGAILAGCGTAGPSAVGLNSYVRSNAMSPVGFYEKQIDATHYEVVGVGMETTTPAWAEKIATARAAQIGVEERLRFFKVDGVRYSARCADKHTTYKGATSAAAYYPVATLAVSFAKGPQPPDPTFQPAGDTYARLSAEMEQGSPDDAGVAYAANKAQCKGS